MKKRDIIIVVVCIVTALACIGLTFWGNLKNNGVLTTDAFMGIIATLIGACATIVVGFQIASFVELRNVKKQVEEVEKERAKIEELAVMLNGTRNALGNAFIVMADTSTDPLNSLASRIMGIVCDNIEDMDSGIVLTRYNNLKVALLSQPESVRAAMTYFVGNLKRMSIPSTIERFVDISKIHYEVISIIDAAWERTNNKPVK